MPEEKKVKRQIQEFEKEKKKDKLKAIFQRVEKGYLEVMKGYFTRDRKLADGVALQREELLKDAGELPAGIAELFRNMVTLTNNIARLVMDEE